MRTAFCESSTTWTRIWRRLAEPTSQVLVVATSSDQDLEAVAAFRPDVLVTRRGMVSAALHRGLRVHPDLARVPVVLATSSEAESAAGGLETAQFDGVLPMPCEAAELDTRLKAVVVRHARLSRRQPLAVVADDSSAARRTVSMHLQRLGFAVIEAADGVEGEEAIRASQPNLAVIDIEMPRLSGLELSARLSADPRTSDIPLLIMSVQVDQALALRGFAAGAIDFLRKPFGLEELSVAVKSLVGREAPQTSSSSLILERCASTASILSRLLAELGSHALIARSPPEFRALATVGTPDLVTLDVSTQDANGLDLLHELRADARFEHVPIVIVSAECARERLVDSLKAGANDFLVKPFLREEMSARVTNLLRARRLQLDVDRRTHELELLAYRDSLTGLGNRRMFDEMLPKEVERAHQLGYPLAVLAIDLDHFKRVNDDHGHATGDEVLREVGRAIAQGIRRPDIACRYGGEEIFVLAPTCAPEDAIALAERIRARCASLVVGTAKVRPTMSIGVSVVPHLSSAARVIEDADAALYRAKHTGRDRVVLHGGVATPPLGPELLAASSETAR